MGFHRERPGLRRLVRLDLEAVVDGRETEEVARRSRSLGFGVKHEFSIVLGRQDDLFGKGITGFDKPDSQLRAELAAGGVDRVRASEIADVETVVGIGRTAVRGLADHHVVLAVIFGGEGTVAVLAVQDRVIGEGLLELVLVEDGHVRIHRALRNRGETQAVDLDADTLAFLHGQFEIVDVLGEDHPFDSLVERDRLRGDKLAVGLLLLDVRERAREELAHVRDAGLRAYAHDVVAGADGLIDRQRELDLVAGAALDALHLEARRVEHQVLEIVEERARDRQLDVSADLAAVRLQRRHAGIGRPRGERGEQERDKETELHKAVQRGAARPSRREGGRMGVQAPVQASQSVMMRPPLTISTGRPPSDMMRFSALMPRTRYMVLARSSGPTASRSGSPPRASEAPWM